MTGGETKPQTTNTTVTQNVHVPPGLIWPPQAYNSSMDWDMWEESLETYFDAKGLDEAAAERKFVLLQALGHETFANLVKWCHPTKPRKKSYVELIATLREKFAKTKNAFTARLRMSSEKQKPEQSEQEYIRHMAALSADCDYKDDKDIVFDILRGLRNHDLQRYLLKPGVKLDTVKELQSLVDTYLSHEKAANAIIQVEKPSSSLMALRSHAKSCGRCGKEHSKFKCPAKDEECRFCKKVGHFEKCCYKRKAKNEKQNLVEEVDDDDNDSNPELLLTVKALNEEDDMVPPLIVPVKVNAMQVEFQHDSGASCSVVGKHIWDLLGRPKLQMQKRELVGYNGKAIEIIGKCLVEAEYNGKVSELPLYVSKNDGYSLLGRPWIKHLEVKSDYFWQDGAVLGEKAKTSKKIPVVELGKEVSSIKEHGIRHRKQLRKADVKHEVKMIREDECKPSTNLKVEEVSTAASRVKHLRTQHRKASRNKEAVKKACLSDIRGVQACLRVIDETLKANKPVDKRGTDRLSRVTQDLQLKLVCFESIGEEVKNLSEGWDIAKVNLKDVKNSSRLESSNFELREGVGE